MDWSAFTDYVAAVRSCVDGMLEQLTDDGLAKEVDMSHWGLGSWSGLEIYLLHGLDHPKLHGGEIACLKGLQGATAWQTPWTPDVVRPRL